MSDADFTVLGDIEFEGTEALWEFCELGRKVASNAGLIVATGAYDIHAALLTIPMMDGNPQRSARRVARHAARAAEHLRGAAVCFGRLPKVFLDTYQPVIAQQRRGGRKPFKLDKTG